jgi:predicted molibdopterin-dependent oxidoreductase YjgC
MILDHLATYFDAQWAHAGAQAVTAEIAQAVPIYNGLTWEALGDQGLQWSVTDHSYVHPEMRYARAVQPELPKVDGGLTLLSGTVLYDGGNLFGLTKQMKNMAFGAEVRLNPADSEKLGATEGETVTVRSDHGALKLAVKLDTTVKPGVAWIPESLPGAPVGALLNGSTIANVLIEK